MRPSILLSCLLAGGLFPVTAPGATAKKRSLDAPPKVAEETHTVRRGETLWSISRENHVSIGEMIELNRLKSESISVGQVLKIPKPRRAAPQTSDHITYVVGKGEDFRTIARQHEISEAELAQANPRVDPDSPRPGTKLIIFTSASRAKQDQQSPNDGGTRSRGTTHVIGENDTYYSIAKKYGITVKALAAANPDVKPERLKPGSRLVIPVKNSSDGDGRSQKPKESEVAKSDRKDSAPRSGLRTYEVSRGESVESIAEAFNISVSKLREINGLNRGTALKPGSNILVPDRRAG